MAEAEKFAESVSRATYGRETRVPIVSAIEHWLGSAEHITLLIRKMIEQNITDTDEPEEFYRQNKQKAYDFNAQNQRKAEAFNAQNQRKAEAFNAQNKDKPQEFYNQNKDKPQEFYNQNWPKAEDFNLQNQGKPHEFYHRNHPEVDNKLRDLRNEYAGHIQTIELTQLHSDYYSLTFR